MVFAARGKNTCNKDTIQYARGRVAEEKEGKAASIEKQIENEKKGANE